MAKVQIKFEKAHEKEDKIALFCYFRQKTVTLQTDIVKNIIKNIWQGHTYTYLFVKADAYTADFILP